MMIDRTNIVRKERSRKNKTERVIEYLYYMKTDQRW